MDKLYKYFNVEKCYHQYTTKRKLRLLNIIIDKMLKKEKKISLSRKKITRPDEKRVVIHQGHKSNHNKTTKSCINNYF